MATFINKAFFKKIKIINIKQQKLLSSSGFNWDKNKLETKPVHSEIRVKDQENGKNCIDLHWVIGDERS